MNEKETWKSKTKEVRIKIPAQDSEIELDIKEPSIDGFTDCLDTKDFKKIRTVAVIKIHKKGDEEEIINQFKPAIVMWVKYKKTDKDKAKDQKSTLKLAYCVGSGKSWVLFDNLEVLEADKEGKVEIEKWEDPAVGWGH